MDSQQSVPFTPDVKISRTKIKADKSVSDRFVAQLYQTVTLNVCLFWQRDLSAV